MPRSHPRYAPEYRQRIIELARAAVFSLSELARQFEPTVDTIRAWEAGRAHEGLRSDGLTTDERAELNQPALRDRVLGKKLT